MNTAVINVKVDPKTKKAAQTVAAELGLSLSAVISGFLHELIRTKSISFNADEGELSDYAKAALKASEEDVKAGRVSPAFDNVADAIKWLNEEKD